MYDTIVIGSGIGGLTTAGLLAGVAGQKVLVLEKHLVPGGLTHVFRRDGASWDVGLHYVGELEPGSLARRLMDYLSGGALAWNRLPDDFDRFVHPGIDVAQPSDPDRFQQRLVALFPDEAPAIRRYFRDIRAGRRWAVLGMVRNMVPRPVAPAIDAWRAVTARTALMTTGAYLESRFRSPRLRALLASQWGDYGLPPSQSAFAVHAMIVFHYLRGAWFPAGGSGRIARAFETGIERAGGAVRVGQEVVEILVEKGRAVGVRVIDRRGPVPSEVVHRARAIVSDVGAAQTFGRLLLRDGETGSRTAALRATCERLTPTLSAVSLYLRLKASPREIGVHGGNVWIAGDDALDPATYTADLMAGRPRSAYVSFPSIKAGDDRFHTAEIISFVDAGAFDAWRDRPSGHRGADYEALKRRIGEGLLRLAESSVPGLSGLVTYSELATPLTVEHYASHARGFYGLSATPERFRNNALGPRTPVPGLFLSGADAAILGIVGSQVGGLAAACQLVPGGFPRIFAALRRGPRRHAAAGTAAVLPPGKMWASLVDRRRLTDDVWHLEFETDVDPGAWCPGQFARLHVGDGEWRDYSLAGGSGRRLRFMISTRTGGHGSRFVEAATPGARIEIEVPLGAYTLQDSGRRRLFVATGTGLAPFVPMFEQLAREGGLAQATLLFGCRTAADDLTRHVAPLPGSVVRCLSRESPLPGGFRGRVTDALAALAVDPGGTDFYLCGSSAMVADCRRLLEERGATHLMVENY